MKGIDIKVSTAEMIVRNEFDLPDNIQVDVFKISTSESGTERVVNYTAYWVKGNKRYSTDLSLPELKLSMYSKPVSG